MTLAQAIAAARHIKVHATDVIELEIKMTITKMRRTGRWTMDDCFSQSLHKRNKQMPECQKELKAAGKPYPRTCPACGLGPCLHGRDRPVFKNADVSYGGRLNGMNEIDGTGEYIGLSIEGLGRVKFNVSQARAVAKDILDATS